jgi:hypothetical protein
MLLGCYACTNRPSLKETFAKAGNNRAELEKVVAHYDSLGDVQKQEAARFLVANIKQKHSYQGYLLDRYDTILSIYHSLYTQGIYDDEPPVAVNMWKELNRRYGALRTDALTPVYDAQTLSANFLIQNIDEAFDAWKASPLYHPAETTNFLEYVLPYRVANETPEVYRKRYRRMLHHILDTISTPDGIWRGFGTELKTHQHYSSVRFLWDHPVEFSITQMERIRKGGCRHFTTFCALVMRACGLPVAVDRAVWANRSSGHSWNVLMLDSGRVLPFEILSNVSFRLVYKPTKIFRQTFSRGEIDVTDQYVPAHDISIPVIADFKENSGKKPAAVICIFDNREWHRVFTGTLTGGKMSFKNMAADVAYLGAYYADGRQTPATRPFLLHADGTIDFCEADEQARIDMKLERKYPLSKRMQLFANGLLKMAAEGANNSAFEHPDTLFTLNQTTYHLTDSLVNPSKRFRYVRLHIYAEHAANLAEVEFYGKAHPQDEEQLLKGTIIGTPDTLRSIAMDGSLENYFEKKKGDEAWVGLDLGRPYYLTRIRFCPRSDTNFILEGDDYELLYWKAGDWHSAGRQKAPQYNWITFREVPTQSMYLLRNHSRGKEERIFTYEEGKQIFW